MSHLYLEAYGPPSRQRLARLIAEAKGDDILAPVTVVVPSQYAGISLRRSLSTGGGLVNVRFMPLSRLAEYLGSPALAEQGKTPLSPITELAAIRLPATEMRGQGPLGNVATHPKLHSSLRSAFRDLATLSEAGLACVEAMDPLRFQTVRWYRLCRDLTSRHYDREELYEVAAQVVQGRSAASVLRDLGFIIFYLISDFSPSETVLVNALSREGLCSVVLGLTGEGETDVLAESTASRLGSASGPARPDGKLQEHEYEVSHMLIAPDAEEEVRWVVRDILRRAEAGLPFHRVAILYRHRDPYAFLIQNQLRFASIPFAGPDATSLRDTPAGKLLAYLLEVIESDYARGCLMRWIAEAPVGAGMHGDLASAKLARWDAISREAAVIKGVDSWKDRLARYREVLGRKKRAASDDPEEADAARINRLEAQIESVESLSTFVNDLATCAVPPEEALWSTYAAWGKGLLRKYAHQPDDWPQDHQASYERVITLLDELGSLDEMVPGGTDLSGFRLMLDDILEKPSGRAGTTGTGVFAGPVADAQAMEFEVVYIVGMAEGSFPPKARENPLLPDQVRTALTETESLRLRQDRRTEERRTFLAALAAGQKRILSFPRADASSQRGQHPSPWFLSEVQRLHGIPVASAEVERLESEPWLSVVHSAQHGLKCAEALASADPHDYDMASIARWHEKGRRLESHFLVTDGSPVHRTLAMERGRRASVFTVWDGCLAELAGTSRRLGLAEHSLFSPTRLERWATCPFRYFLCDVLDISVLDQPEEVMTISAMDRGTLLHRVLERFVKVALKQEKPLDFGEPWNESHRELLMSLAEEEFDRAVAGGATGRRLLWELAKDEMRQDLALFLEEDSRWRDRERSRPLWAELKFGLDGEKSLPPVTLTLRNGARVSLRGMIDRVDIDTSGTKMIVVDYKFGSSSPFKDMDKDPLGGGRHLQLPAYALAVREAAADPVDVIACYWFATARGSFQMKGVSLDEVEDRFRENVEILAAGIEQGLFPANPGLAGGQGNCKYCDFDRVCPAGRDLVWERKRPDPTIANYLKLSGTEPSEESND